MSRLRVAGGFGSSSKGVTLLAPWRSSTDTVVTSVTTSNHDNIFAAGLDIKDILKLPVQKRFGVLLQVLYSKVDAVRAAARDFRSRGPVAPVHRTILGLAVFASRDEVL